MPDRSDRQRPSLTALTAFTCIAACVLATAVSLLLPGVSRADPTAACAMSEMSSSSQPACWRPFTASSPFNTQLPSIPPLASDNAAVQQHMATYGWSLDGSGNGGFTLDGNGTRPVYFASPSDPVMTVHCTDEDGPGTCQGANRVDVNGVQIHVPAGALPDSNWDAHMTVIEAATDTEYDFWHVSISGSTLTAGSGAEVNVDTTNGSGSAGDAADFALTAGLLRPSELASGQIDHALVITVPCTNATGANVGYTYPALGGWGEHCGQYWNEAASTAPMLGQRFQLDMSDAQIAASGAPTWEQTIMTALAHYGAYIEDTNGSYRYEGMDILTQDPTSWTSLGQSNPWASVMSALGGHNSTLTSTVPIPVSKLQLVSTCVTQGTCPGAATPPPATTNTPAPTRTTTSTPPPTATTTTGTVTTTRAITPTTTTSTPVTQPVTTATTTAVTRPTTTAPSRAAPAATSDGSTRAGKPTTPPSSSSNSSHPVHKTATRKRLSRARHAKRSVRGRRRRARRVPGARRPSRRAERRRGHARR